MFTRLLISIVSIHVSIKKHWIREGRDTHFSFSSVSRYFPINVCSSRAIKKIDLFSFHSQLNQASPAKKTHWHMPQPNQHRTPVRSHRKTAYEDTYSTSCSAQKQSGPCPSAPEPTLPPRHLHLQLAPVQTQRPSDAPSREQTAPS